MPSMSEIEWEPCLLTQRPAPELELRFERQTGRLGRLMRYFQRLTLDRRHAGARVRANQYGRPHRS